MILSEQKQTTVIKEVDFQTLGMSLDMESAQSLMQILSTSLYSDPIGSTIREVASNALDSHRRAGVEEPIIVGLSKSNLEFYVEDFGLGLDDVDVENIISKYGKSTKKNSNIELGMFGLGFKAPLAYNSSFIFICRKNGIERTYTMYQGELNNEISLLNEQPTDEKNGVKVIIKIKNNDYKDFENEIYKQLRYFEGVYFEVSNFNNSYNIYKFKDYQILSKDLSIFHYSSTDKMHICLDNVYYPIDWEKIKMDAVCLNIAIRFSLEDGIYPTPNRESIRYTPDAIKLIRDKIKSVANELIQNHKDDLLKNGKLLDYILTNHHTVYYKPIKDVPSIQLDLTNLKSVSDIEISTNCPKYPNINIKDIYDSSYCLLNNYIYSWAADNYNEGKRTSNYKYNSMFTTFLYSKSYNIKIFVDDLENRSRASLVRKYLNTIHRSMVVIVKNSDFNKDDLKHIKKSVYTKALDLYNTDLELSQIVELLEELVETTSVKLSDVVVPDAFLESQKVNSSNKTRTYRNSDNINVDLGEISKSKNSRCKFTPISISFNTIRKYKKIMVYTNRNNKDKISMLYGVFKKVDVSICSDKEISKIKSLGLQNWVHYDDFINSNHKILLRMITCYNIIQMTGYSSYDYSSNASSILLGYKISDWSIQRFNDDFAKTLPISKNYLILRMYLEHCIEDSSNLMALISSLDLSKEKLNYVDFRILGDYKKVQKFAKDNIIYDFINIFKIRNYFSENKDNILNYIRKLARVSKQKMIVNSSNYSLK